MPDPIAAGHGAYVNGVEAIKRAEQLGKGWSVYRLTGDPYYYLGPTTDLSIVAVTKGKALTGRYRPARGDALERSMFVKPEKLFITYTVK